MNFSFVTGNAVKCLIFWSIRFFEYFFHDVKNLMKILNCEHKIGKWRKIDEKMPRRKIWEYFGKIWSFQCEISNRGRLSLCLSSLKPQNLDIIKRVTGNLIKDYTITEIIIPFLQLKLGYLTDRERVAPYLKSRTEKLIFHQIFPIFFCGVFFDLFFHSFKFCAHILKFSKKFSHHHKKIQKY